MQPSPVNASAPTPQPIAWWRVGFVWLVVGGPLAVVLASLVTAVIAVSGAEEVLTAAHVNANTAGADSARMPAVQARNHAATPKH